MKRIILWFKIRRLKYAQRVIESHGLMVVRVKEIGGAVYFVRPDGQHLRLKKDKP